MCEEKVCSHLLYLQPTKLWMNDILQINILLSSDI